LKVKYNKPHRIRGSGRIRNLKSKKIMEETKEYQQNVRTFIAKRISYAIAASGMTQRQLADKLGKHESEISKWLTGSHNFTINSIASIEIALGVEIFIIPKDPFV